MVLFFGLSAIQYIAPALEAFLAFLKVTTSNKKKKKGGKKRKKRKWTLVAVSLKWHNIQIKVYALDQRVLIKRQIELA